MLGFIKQNKFIVAWAIIYLSLGAYSVYDDVTKDRMIQAWLSSVTLFVMLLGLNILMFIQYELYASYRRVIEAYARGAKLDRELIVLYQNYVKNYEEDFLKQKLAIAKLQEKVLISEIETISSEGH